MWPLRHSAHVRSWKESWEWAGRKTALETTRNASVASNAKHDFHEGRRYAAIQRLKSVGQWTPKRRRRFPKKFGSEISESVREKPACCDRAPPEGRRRLPAG
jgi:hypothetical protein